MSAWDITGAVVWGAFSALLIHSMFHRGTNGQGKFLCLLLLFPVLGAAAFCAARLFGAQA